MGSQTSSSMRTLRKRLENYNDKVKTATDNLQVLQGRLLQLQETLKEDFDVEDLEEAQELLEQMEANLEEQDAKIRKRFRALEKKMGTLDDDE